MRVTKSQGEYVVVFPYRGYDISLSNIFYPSCCVFPQGAGHAIGDRTFPCSAEGIRLAMSFIDKLSGPKRICSGCNLPVLSGHKFTSFRNSRNGKRYWVHRCCRYPDYYTVTQGEKNMRRQRNVSG